MTLRLTLLTALGLLAAASATAQENVADTLVRAGNPPAVLLPDSLTLPTPYQRYSSGLPQLPPLIDFAPAPAALSSDFSISDYITYLSRPGVMASWRGGAVYGSVSSTYYPGMMGVEEGRLGLVQRFGRLSVEAYGEAALYGSMMGLTRSLGVGGSVSYTISPNLSMSVFGSYHTTSGAFTPAMAGYMSVPTFGGFLDYRFGSSRWGVKAGAQSYRSMLDGHWHTQPIVMPYYRVGASEIGVDVGGILYNVLKGSSARNVGNPTIAPPKMGTLPVGPTPPPPPGR